MKFIDKYKSPNFNRRNNINSIKYIIMHYTAMTNHMEAIEHLCLKSNKVSSHFLISKEGKIYNLVDIEKRAWHVGEAFWKGESDINSSSIGIEIDNSGHHIKFENYTILQIKSLIKLIQKLSHDYNISAHNILGHSDVSPYRKIDPGEKFPWTKLYNKKIGYLPKNDCLKNAKRQNNEITEKLGILSGNKDKKLIYMLKKIGYDTRKADIDPKSYHKLIRCYQMHYLQNKVTGVVDLDTYNLIVDHYNEVLTL